MPEFEKIVIGNDLIDVIIKMLPVAISAQYEPLSHFYPDAPLFELSKFSGPLGNKVLDNPFCNMNDKGLRSFIETVVGNYLTITYNKTENLLTAIVDSLDPGVDDYHPQLLKYCKKLLVSKDAKISTIEDEFREKIDIENYAKIIRVLCFAMSENYIKKASEKSKPPQPNMYYLTVHIYNLAVYAGNDPSKTAKVVRDLVRTLQKEKVVAKKKAVTKKKVEEKPVVPIVEEETSVDVSEEESFDL